MTFVRARGLRKDFRNTVALAGVDLTVEEGRIVGLIGPNGVGKSIALQAIVRGHAVKMLNTMYRVSSGWEAGFLWYGRNLKVISPPP